MKQFKVGDRVISTEFGKGVVKNIDKTSHYPVEVEFDDIKIFHFTLDGKILKASSSIDLSHYTEVADKEADTMVIHVPRNVKELIIKFF
jgi:hypothetical protein